jgi:hypothetical protein
VAQKEPKTMGSAENIRQVYCNMPSVESFKARVSNLRPATTFANCVFGLYNLGSWHTSYFSKCGPRNIP